MLHPKWRKLFKLWPAFYFPVVICLTVLFPTVKLDLLSIYNFTFLWFYVLGKIITESRLIEIYHYLVQSESEELLEHMEKMEKNSIGFFSMSIIFLVYSAISFYYDLNNWIDFAVFIVLFLIKIFSSLIKITITYQVSNKNDDADDNDDEEKKNNSK